MYVIFIPCNNIILTSDCQLFTNDITKPVWPVFDCIVIHCKLMTGSPIENLINILYTDIVFVSSFSHVLLLLVQVHCMVSGLPMKN